MGGQHRDVLGPIAQRRHRDGDDVEPIEQILSKPFLLDHLREILIGRGDDTNIDTDRPRRAEPLELAFLKHAQDLRLGHRGEVADLVEEQRAGVGQLEAPFLAAGGAGEGALLVAEQLGLQEILGQGGAVDGDERAVLARRALVDGPRHALLAGAALAEDEHGGRGVGHLLDQRHHAPEGRAGADHRPLAQQVVQALLQRLVLLDELAALERLVDQLQELLAAEGLGEEVVGAVLHGLDGFLHRAERGQEDDVQVGRDGLGRAQQLEAGEPRHLEVGDDEVDAAALHALQRGASVGGQQHAVALARQRALEALAQAGIVVGDQQRGGIRHGRPAA